MPIPKEIIGVSVRVKFYGVLVKQVLRFGFVGLISNLVLYLLYLLLTTVGLGHKVAMTLLFAGGAILTFVFNKHWTFAHRGFPRKTFFKYVAAYSFAYLLNLMALLVFVDRLAFTHQFVQGVMILTLALMLFMLQKYWVFSSPSPAGYTETQAAS